MGSAGSIYGGTGSGGLNYNDSAATWRVFEGRPFAALSYFGAYDGGASGVYSMACADATGRARLRRRITTMRRVRVGGSLN